IDDRVSTNVVAADMPMAVSSLPDTPMNGHSPRNWVSTKLFTSIAPSKSSSMSVIAVDQVARLLGLNKFDHVAIGILDERDNRAAMLHRAGGPHHIATFGADIVAGLVRIVD